MLCPNCNFDSAATAMYCEGCGIPLAFDVADIQADEERKQNEALLRDGIIKAKDLLVLALFLLGCVIALRVVLLRERPISHLPSYRVPHSVVQEGLPEPPQGLEVPELEIPLPETR